jgi:hypothetical protein
MFKAFPLAHAGNSRLLQLRTKSDTYAMFSLIIATAAFAGVAALSTKFGTDSRVDDGRPNW